MWLALAGVKPLPVGVVWQLVQLVTPVWFIVAGVHTVPIAWQVAQLVLVIGATVCAFVPLTGRPAFGVVAPAVS